MALKTNIPIYAISDLHLFHEMGDQPVREGELVFDPYPADLVRNWEEIVEPEAWVLIPGDISDSHGQGALCKDYEFLDQLPGRKLLSPGNHDWPPWGLQASIERFCRPFSSLRPSQNGIELLDAPGSGAPLMVVSACGACAPGDVYFGGEPHRTGASDPQSRFEIELERFGKTLRQARSLKPIADKLLVQIHFPPFINFDQPGPFSELIEANEVDFCFYGHLHHEEEAGFEGERNGVTYRLVSAPRLRMKPLRLGLLTTGGLIDELKP